MGAKFVGKFEHSIDSKGRLMIPSKYRAIIGEQTLYILPKNRQNLVVFTEEGFDRFASDWLAQEDITDEEENEFSALLAEADYVTLDPQGRILVNQRLRDVADLTKDVVINGRLDRFEIWSPARYEEVRGEKAVSDESIQQTMRRRGIRV